MYMHWIVYVFWTKISPLSLFLCFRGSLRVNATIIKDASEPTTADMAQASLELATQQDGVDIFGGKYYVDNMTVGGQPSKWRVTYF